jgi:hypothetical protein
LSQPSTENPSQPILNAGRTPRPVPRAWPGSTPVLLLLRWARAAPTQPSPRIGASCVPRQREVAGDNKLAGRGSPSGDLSSLQRPWARGSACESGSRWGRDRRCGLPAPGSQAWPRRDRAAESPPAIVKRKRWWEISSWTSFCRILIRCPINQLDAHSGNR